MFYHLPLHVEYHLSKILGIELFQILDLGNICEYVMHYLGDESKSKHINSFMFHIPYTHTLKVNLYNIFNNFVH